jgi:molybdopterin-biosynthesis enzyme MoeA-like protein
MADLPPNSELIFNPINNMSGFSLDKRFFFVPGFPIMAHPMLSEIIKKYFSNKKINFRKTLLAQTSENTLIDIMQKIPPNIELSSLPIFKNNKASVELSLSGTNQTNIKQYFLLFIEKLDKENIKYKILQ